MRKKATSPAVIMGMFLAIMVAGSYGKTVPSDLAYCQESDSVSAHTLEEVLAADSGTEKGQIQAVEVKAGAGEAFGSGDLKPEVEKEAEIEPNRVEPVTAKNESLKASSKFVLLAEAVPDVIQEIRYYSTYNFVGEPIDGYEEPCAILTKEAATALKEVSDEVVAKGYRLKVYDAYRPQSAVDHFVRWASDESDIRMKAYFYPDLEKGVLFDQGYIGRKSGHSRGSTVDLTLFDMKTGKEVDMGGTFDYFGRRSHPDYTGDLTEEQLNNRKLLREAMMSHGFKPLSTEWWHFTLEQEPYPGTYFNFPVSSSWYTDEQQ